MAPWDVDDIRGGSTSPTPDAPGSAPSQENIPGFAPEESTKLAWVPSARSATEPGQYLGGDGRKRIVGPEECKTSSRAVGRRRSSVPCRCRPADSPVAAKPGSGGRLLRGREGSVSHPLGGKRTNAMSTPSGHDYQAAEKHSNRESTRTFPRCPGEATGAKDQRERFRHGEEEVVATKLMKVAVTRSASGTRSALVNGSWEPAPELAADVPPQAPCLPRGHPCSGGWERWAGARHKPEPPRSSRATAKPDQPDQDPVRRPRAALKRARCAIRTGGDTEPASEGPTNPRNHGATVWA